MADKAGVLFIPRNGQEANHYAILETLGTGVALFDYDLDGDLDIFFPGGGRFGPKSEIFGCSPALYRNNGLWRFEEVTKLAGLDENRFYSLGAIAGDYNDDGATDLLVTGFGGVLFYRNCGDGSFEEVAQSIGLVSSAWNTSAGWGDLNGDSILDLYLVRYVDWSLANNPVCYDSLGRQRDVCPPGHFKPVPDTLYLGVGDGAFRDATSESGISEAGMGLAVLLGDVDVDGDLDIYVANDTTPNLLYRNNGKGTFREVGIESGVALSDTSEADGSMGVDLGDFNQDGLPDLWVSNFEDQTFALYRNEGDCLFKHVSNRVGIGAMGGVYVGFGTGFFDMDRDGDEDLFATNGHVMRVARNAPVRQPPLLFENLGGERFANVAATSGPYLASPHLGRGAAFGDLDQDGDVDVAVAHANEPVALLSNECQNQNHWVSLHLIGTVSNRDGIGARIRVTAGGQVQRRFLCGGRSYLSTNDRTLFFGLSDHTRIEEIEVRWPSGATTRVAGCATNSRLTLIELPY